MDWLGRAKIAFTSAPSPLPLKLRDGTATDLAKIAADATPPCQLNPVLFNGHMQTIWTAAKPSAPAVHYRRRLFEADHEVYNGTFSADFAVKLSGTAAETDTNEELPPRTTFWNADELAKQDEGSDDARPMLVVLHGLSGGSHEVYLRHAIAPLLAEGSDWQVIVLNSRGCAKTKITSGVLYNARATWDVRQFVKWLATKYPNRPLFGLGFSLGACMLTNYVAEEGANCLFKAAMVCGCPFNLETASKFMQSSYFSKEVYLRVMGTSMRTLVETHRESIETHTNLDVEKIKKCTYLYEFDREVQCPTWGYPTTDAYYRDASCADAILAIRIPFLALSATDDPIAVKECIPYDEFKQNPYTVLCTTSLGGHLAWFEIGSGRWHSKPIGNFFKFFASKVDFSSIVSKVPNGIAESKQSRGPSFDPMRRRLQLVPQE